MTPADQAEASEDLGKMKTEIQAIIEEAQSRKAGKVSLPVYRPPASQLASPP
jgi:hypothetical protein